MEQAACAQASPVVRGEAAATAAEGAKVRAELGGSNCGQGAARGAALEEAPTGGRGAVLEEAPTGKASDARSMDGVTQRTTACHAAGVRLLKACAACLKCAPACSACFWCLSTPKPPSAHGHWPCHAAGAAGKEARDSLAEAQPVAPPAAALPGTGTPDLTMAGNAALRVAAEAGPTAGSQAAASKAASAKAQPPAKRAAAGEAAPADSQPPAKRAKQDAAPAAAVTLPSSAEAKAALLQQLEADIGQLVKDAAAMSPLAALPAALTDAQKAKGLVKAEVGLQHWNGLLNNMMGRYWSLWQQHIFCQRRLSPGPDANE